MSGDTLITALLLAVVAFILGVYVGATQFG